MNVFTNGQIMKKNEAVMSNSLILFGGNEFLKEGEKSTFNF